MLDIDVIVPPTQNGLDIVPLAEFKRHLHITHSRSDADLESAIIDAGDHLNRDLNRTVFPTTWKRYLQKFPDLLDDRGCVVSVGRGIIPLPFPPLIGVLAVTIEDGSSPDNDVDSTTYVVRTGTLVPEIELKADESWPDYTAGPRAISITYRAGYTAYPPALKRYVKMLAGHYVQNREATILEPRVMQINRKVEYGLADLKRQFLVSANYDDWGE